MNVIETAIPGVLIVEPPLRGDARGFFMELYQEERYAGAGIASRFVQDNLSLSDWMARTLQTNRFSVDRAHNGADADHLLHTQVYDLVILDLSLPKLDGHEVLKRLRARRNNVPVLILTATNTVEGRILGLNEGADDYMAKPFDLNELEARIRAILRRFNQNKNPVLECGSLRYDSNTRAFALGASVARRSYRALRLPHPIALRP